MTIVRRLSLLGFVLVAPSMATALLYAGTHALLRATHRIIDPQVVWYAAMIELAVFFFFAVLEARDRW
ncbi:MAG TPA: hypothetical protein VGL35_07160 [Rhizomicrobium sp.]|jgi:hypothetical protein